MLSQMVEVKIFALKCNPTPNVVPGIKLRSAYYASALPLSHTPGVLKQV